MFTPPGLDRRSIRIPGVAGGGDGGGIASRVGDNSVDRVAVLVGRQRIRRLLVHLRPRHVVQVDYQHRQRLGFDHVQLLVPEHPHLVTEFFPSQEPREEVTLLRECPRERRFLGEERIRIVVHDPRVHQDAVVIRRGHRHPDHHQRLEEALARMQRRVLVDFVLDGQRHRGRPPGQRGHRYRQGPRLTATRHEVHGELQVIQGNRRVPYDLHSNAQVSVGEARVWREDDLAQGFERSGDDDRARDGEQEPVEPALNGEDRHLDPGRGSPTRPPEDGVRAEPHRGQAQHHFAPEQLSICLVIREALGDVHHEQQQREGYDHEQLHHHLQQEELRDGEVHGEKVPDVLC
eukprot:31418-Pelagococcus_subviridis.AAC.11